MRRIVNESTNENAGILILKNTIAFLIFVFFAGASSSAFAFYCSNATFDSGSGGSYYSNKNNAVSVPRQGAVTLSLTSNTINCYEGAQREYLRVESVTLNPKLVTAGFTASTLKIGSQEYAYPFTTAIGQCIWPAGGCNAAMNDRSAAISGAIKRAGSGPDLTMANGETLLTVVTVLYSNVSGVNRKYTEHTNTLYYRLAGAITPATYTCDITNPDNNVVTLPTIKRSDIVSQNIGKIAASKTEFNFQLQCQPGTVVHMSLQDNGNVMTGTGTDSVLKNRNAGNEDIGFQIFKDTTPLQFGTSYSISDNTDANELLKLNAYYYWRGGAVQAGKVKSNAQFDFTYQ